MATESVKLAHVPMISLEDFTGMSETQQRHTIYRAIIDAHNAVVDIQNEAFDLVSPEKLAGMFGSFMGLGA